MPKSQGGRGALVKCATSYNGQKMHFTMAINVAQHPLLAHSLWLIRDVFVVFNLELPHWIRFERGSVVFFFRFVYVFFSSPYENLFLFNPFTIIVFSIIT